MKARRFRKIAKKMIGIVAASLLIVGMVQPVSAALIWHSYDATIRTSSGDLIRGDILDANTSSVNAALKFYTSSDVLGVAEAASVTTGGNGVYSTVPPDANLHAEVWQDGLDLIVDLTNYWRIPGGNGAFKNNISTANTDWFTPFVAKQLTARPADGGDHGDLPGGVTGVYDLAFHPPGLTGDAEEQQFKNQLGVIAFIAPEDGEYEITNFGARAIQFQGAASDTATQSVHIFDDGGTLLDSIACGGLTAGTDTRDITWKLSGNTTKVTLAAGEEIHFAVHATATLAVAAGTEVFWWDATNVAFDIELLEPEPDPIPEPSTFLLLGVGVSLAGRRRRKRA